MLPLPEQKTNQSYTFVQRLLSFRKDEVSSFQSEHQAAAIAEAVAISQRQNLQGETHTEGNEAQVQPNESPQTKPQRQPQAQGSAKKGKQSKASRFM